VRQGKQHVGRQICREQRHEGEEVRALGAGQGIALSRDQTWSWSARVTAVWQATGTRFGPGYGIKWRWLSNLLFVRSSALCSSSPARASVTPASAASAWRR